MKPMRANYVLMLLIVLAAPACSKGGDVGNGTLLIDSGVILDSGQLDQTSSSASLLDVSGPYWTPTEEQAFLADRAVLEHLRQMNTARSQQIADALGDYKRQYIGYTVGGKRWMLINAVCRSYWERNESWKSTVVVTLDGGICFFKAHFELATSTVQSLEVNGDA